MGRRKLLPNINNLLLQLHLQHRNSGSQPNESNQATEGSAPKESTHREQDNNKNTSSVHHHHNLHIFTWPSLKSRPSSSSLASSSSVEDDHDPDTDTDNEIDALKHSNTICNNDTINSHKSVVSFGHCEVRSYTQVLGDHPCCSEGCPIQLGWSYTCEESMKVDDYERCYHTMQRDVGENTSSALVPKYTVLQDLRLSAEERRSILILCKQQEYVNATTAANTNDVDCGNSASNDDNDACSSSSSAVSEGEDTPSLQQPLSSLPSPSNQLNCERELSRECRRLNRCGGWNVNVKASRKRNKRNQEAFFGSPTRTTSKSAIKRIPSESIAAPVVL